MTAFTDQEFVSGTTITSTWLNGVNDSLKDYTTSKVVSIKDAQFGGVGNGVVNDTAAFEALITYCATSGAKAYLPAGTYLVDPSTRTFSGSKPFVISGDGRGVTILKNSSTSDSFIYWTGANGVSFENLGIDGSFTGLPSVPVSGGTLVLVNSNDNTIRNVDFHNIYRVAVMIYNDHQTTLANVYGGHIVDNCRIYGPSNYSGNVGPSAFILADVNNSTIKNCYINQIGLYGYEFKNDSSNNQISNCVAEDVYYPIYFGGDGSHTELGYTKSSLVSDCVIRRATSGVAVTLGSAWNNTIKGVSIDQTGVATSNIPIYITNTSLNNTVIANVKGRNNELATVRNASNGNYVEIMNIQDGVYTGRGSTGIGSDCSNNTFVFGNRDSTHQLFLESYSFNDNNITDKKYSAYNYSATLKPLYKIRFGDVGLDSIPTTGKGLAVVGNTADYFQTSAQASTYQYFGTFAKHDVFTTRYRTSDGIKFESQYNGSTTSTYVTYSGGFYPQEDNVRKLGDVSNRWSTIYGVTLKLSPVTVATLTPAATIGAGAKAFVSDATTTTFASIVVGGGANIVPVYSDGTNWRIG